MIKEASKGKLNTGAVRDLKLDIENRRQGMSKPECFISKPANAWIEDAKSRPIPNMLFGEMWYEGEVCILFADTNTGKSILAVQIADSISKGVPIEGFRLEVEPQKTIYFDFELSDKQFEKRYSNDYRDHYRFSDNLIRAEINSEMEVPKEFGSFEDFLVHSIYQTIKKHDPKVLVIDNITYLKADNERAKDALSLMKELKSISKKYGISILVLAHTPKRESSRALTKSDLAGSKMLINFCDSAIAIGESVQGAGYRYIKQIKQRNTECIYHADNVALFEIRQDHNFLNFNYVGCDQELAHLAAAAYSEKENRSHEILELNRQGLSNVEIAKQLGVSEGTVRYQLKKAA